MTAEISATRIEEEKRAFREIRTQRFTLVVGVIVFGAGAPVIVPGIDSTVHIGALGLLVINAIAFCFLRPGHAHVPTTALPIVSALAFSGAMIAVMTTDSAPDAIRFALMYAVLAPYLGLLAPTRRGAVGALAAMSIVAVPGALYLETRASSFHALSALTLMAGVGALALSIVYMLERARRDAALLRTELARRATSDDISGVSNRAHISLLAQNEFSRARRYGEPYSCLTIEIEGYDELAESHGRAGANAVVQMFTGYCVVVMRHCDSFGRLTPNRFLALLPETPTAGAHTLAERMCRDLAGLGVACGGETLRFTVSIGCAQMHAVDRWVGDMLRRAEQGLADAIERGGNCAVFAAVPMSPPSDTGQENAADPDEAARR